MTLGTHAHHPDDEGCGLLLTRDDVREIVVQIPRPRGQRRGAEHMTFFSVAWRLMDDGLPCRVRVKVFAAEGGCSEQVVRRALSDLVADSILVVESSGEPTAYGLHPRLLDELARRSLAAGAVVTRSGRHKQRARPFADREESRDELALRLLREQVEQVERREREEAVEWHEPEEEGSDE